MAQGYSTIVVGTDGSTSSMLAVERAAQMAAAFEARLVIGCAYYENEESLSNSRRRDTVAIVGESVAADTLREASDYARQLGASTVDVAVQSGSPVQALMAIVRRFDADLLIVGNRGINSLTGRLLGSVPADIARQSDCDVMIVHTVQEQPSPPGA